MPNGERRKKDQLDRWGDRVFKDYIGYTPDSSAVKPVHIANGLFRICLGEYYKTDRLHEWIERGASSGIEKASAEFIREKYKGIIKNSEMISEEEINMFRAFLKMIFNHDGAAAPSSGFSVYNISSRLMVSKSVAPEASINSFIYRILNTKINQSVSPVIRLIQQCLCDETDDLSKLVKPIYTVKPNKEYTDIIKISDRILADYQDSNNKLDGLQTKIRESYDILCNNCIELSENKLIVLERIINLSSFSVIYHLINKIMQAASYEIDNIPMLFDSGVGLPAIKYTSEESFLIAKQKVEEYFEHCIRKIFFDFGYNMYTHEQVINEIDRMELTEEKDGNAEGKRESFKALYLRYYEKINNPYLAFSKATQFLLFTDVYRTSPSDFCSYLGQKAGLVGPARSTSKRKRFLPNPMLLETLLLSSIKYGEELTLREFASRLWDKFGIIIGANGDEDYERLAYFNIADRAPGDLLGELAANTRELADIYISMGYGKRYADGVTTIYIKR